MRRLMILALLWLIMAPASAALTVFATVPEWAALVQEIGGAKVKVYAATHALQDPHRVEARPSLLARQAQLVVATGADLEIGWLPVVLRDSGNAAIQPGRPGYFEAAPLVSKLDIPGSLDRAHGDVHPAGNPHIQLDPRNILKIGEALAGRLTEVDPANGAAYQTGYKAFSEKWQAAMARWETRAAPLKGVPVLVHHKSFPYLLAWLGMVEAGALELKPGVEPSSGHLSDLLARRQTQAARMVLRTAYQGDGPSLWIAGRAKIPAVMLPFTVGGTAEAKDLFGLFDDTVSRLVKALQ